MTQTLRSYSQNIAAILDTVPQNITAEEIRDILSSTTGAYCMLDNTGVDKAVTLVIAPTVTELGSGGGGTPFAGVNSNSDTLTGSATTGRITIGADTKASGTYLIGWRMAFIPDQTTTFPATLPDTVIVACYKNGAAGTSIGAADLAVLNQGLVHLPLDGASGAGTTTQYCGGRANAFVAKDLVIMSALGVDSDNIEKWTGIQVTNLGASGSGTTDLFSAAKTTEGSTITAGLARAFTFNPASAASRNIGAIETLKVVVTKTNSPNALTYMAVRGYESRLFSMSGFTIADLVGGTDYISLAGYEANGVVGLTAKTGYLFAKRLR